MDVEISPEPTSEERAAIVAAVRQLLEAEEADPGRWWEAGLRENLEDEEDL